MRALGSSWNLRWFAGLWHNRKVAGDVRKKQRKEDGDWKVSFGNFISGRLVMYAYDFFLVFDRKGSQGSHKNVRNESLLLGGHTQGIHPWKHGSPQNHNKNTSSSIPTSILPSRDLLEADVTIQLLRRPMTLGTLPTEAQGAVLLQDLATAVGREGSGTALGPSIALAARTATMAQLVTMQRAEGELPVTPETRGLQVIIGCSWNSFVLGPLGYQLRFPSAEALWWQCALNATGGAEVLDFRGVSYSPKSFQPIFDFSDRWSKPLRRYWKLVWGGHVKRETQTPDDDTVDGSQIRRFTSWGW